MNQNDYRWYAVQVRARFEKIVALHMENKGFEAYLPIYPAARQWPDRVKQVDVDAPLFPGYVFSKFDGADPWPILTIPGVLSVVDFAETIDAGQEIENLRRVVNSGLSHGSAGSQATRCGYLGVYRWERQRDSQSRPVLER
jgi:transcriptional antiterminator NusG